MATWTAAYINSLPDSSFLYIEPGGSKDQDGRTTPRSLRHFPYRDANGNIDLPHLRNALARIPQSSLPPSVKESLMAKARRILEAQRQNELETVDLEGVEILAAGGPVRGVGSPPEGDYWTPEDLRAMAAAAAELGDELKPPAKIGHRGDMPAVGWLSNLRVNEDASRLLADIKRVPAKFAEILKAGGYRTRSVELARYTSQRTGKTYDWAVTGLAWLGGKIPAVQTLDDVVKLYDGHGAEPLFVQLDDREPPVEERLLESMYALAVDAYQRLAGEIAGDDDSRGTMAPSPYTDEQRRAFQEATGLDDATVTDELMAAAGVAPAGHSDGGDGGEPADGRALEAEVAEARRVAEEAKREAEEAREQLRLNQRDQFVERVLREGKEPPARRQAIETLYDKLGHEDAVKHYADARVDETLIREYGSETETNERTDEETKAYEQALERELAAIFPGYEAQT